MSLDEEIERLKVNQVVKVLGYWNEKEGTLRAFAPGHSTQGQSMTVNPEWAGNVSFENGQYYQVLSAITLKEAWNDGTDGINLMDYDFDFQNYIANVLVAPTTPTGIENLDTTNAVSVRYYNLQGIESATPFNGVNVVVMQMNDGSKKVVKVIK